MGRSLYYLRVRNVILIKSWMSSPKKSNNFDNIKTIDFCMTAQNKHKQSQKTNGKPVLKNCNPCHQREDFLNLRSAPGNQGRKKQLNRKMGKGHE